jgi:hypothetical protein
VARSVLDTRLPYRGGSDRWDQGPAGAIVTTEFLGPQPPPGAGAVLLWLAGRWRSRPVRVWLAGVWVEKPARRWSGTAWVLT